MPKAPRLRYYVVRGLVVQAGDPLAAYTEYRKAGGQAVDAVALPVKKADLLECPLCEQPTTRQFFQSHRAQCGKKEAVR